MKKIFYRLLTIICVVALVAQIGSQSALALTLGDGAGDSPSESEQYDFKFGITDSGVSVNKDGSWSVEMYLEGANDSFEYDAWYGIYDLGVIPDSALDSQGAWGYVIPKADTATEPALKSGDEIPTKRFTFSFCSQTDLTDPAEGKSVPVLGGTYNLYLFYADHGEDQYKIARSTVITIPELPLLSADYEHVIVIGIDGAGTFFQNTPTPNIDRIFSNDHSAISYSVRTEDPSMSAQNWAAMLHGVADDYHGIDNDFAYANECLISSLYPSVFKVLRDNDPNAKLGAFTNWTAINTGIIENGIGVDKIYGMDDASITAEVVNYVKENSPQFVFVQMDEADAAGHTFGFNSQQQLDKITQLDEYVGQIYSAYEEMGILDKTLFIVTSDHGGTPSATHGGMSAEEINVMFAATGKTVVRGTIGTMAVRDTAAVVLHAMGAVIPTVYQARVPDNLFEDTVRQPEFTFALTEQGVTVTDDLYEIEMYIEGADDRFGHDAWFGIYNGNVTAEDIYQNGDALSLGAWGYVSSDLDASVRLGSEKQVFTFKSSSLIPNENNPVIGGTYTVFLFYTNGHEGNKYVVADSIGITIKNKDNIDFGVAEKGVTLRPDGLWSANMYFVYDGTQSADFWYGIYDADVSAQDIGAQGSAISYLGGNFISCVVNEDDLTPKKYSFSFNSFKNSNLNNPNPLLPGRTYNVYLFEMVDGEKKYDPLASFPLHVPGVANTGDGYLQFGFVNQSDRIVVNEDGSWELKLFISGADARFDGSAWIGIYNADATIEQILSYDANVSEIAHIPLGVFTSDRRAIKVDSSMITSGDNLLKIGGSYKLVLFYSDYSPNSGVVARMVPFTLLSTNPPVVEDIEPEPEPEPQPEPEPEPVPEPEPEPEPEETQLEEMPPEEDRNIAAPIIIAMLVTMVVGTVLVIQLIKKKASI